MFSLTDYDNRATLFTAFQIYFVAKYVIASHFMVWHNPCIVWCRTSQESLCC